jgi:cytochrome oxidase assembly protein ShyY1
MYDFLRKPAWIVSHVLVVALVVALVALGLWQRSRWLEVGEQNDRFRARTTAEAAPLAEVLGPGVDEVAEVPADAEYRRVVLRGRYDTAAEVSIRSRSQGGSPGAWVLTPLLDDAGVVVPVVRGWVPLDVAAGGPPFRAASPPEGDVVVTGVVQLSQQRGGFGAADPPTGRLEDLSRVDVARFARQVEGAVAPIWVQLDGQSPPQPVDATGAPGLPRQVAVELRDPSTNFSYMVQWWIFATIAAGGYVLVLRRVARQRASGGAVPVDDVDDGPPGDDADPPVTAGVGDGTR